MNFKKFEKAAKIFAMMAVSNALIACSTIEPAKTSFVSQDMVIEFQGDVQKVLAVVKKNADFVDTTKISSQIKFQASGVIIEANKQKDGSCTIQIGSFSNLSDPKFFSRLSTYSDADKAIILEAIVIHEMWHCSNHSLISADLFSVKSYSNADILSEENRADAAALRWTAIHHASSFEMVWDFFIQTRHHHVNSKDHDTLSFLQKDGVKRELQFGQTPLVDSVKSLAIKYCI